MCASRGQSVRCPRRRRGDTRRSRPSQEPRPGGLPEVVLQTHKQNLALLPTGPPSSRRPGTVRGSSTVTTAARAAGIAAVVETATAEAGTAPISAGLLIGGLQRVQRASTTRPTVEAIAGMSSRRARGLVRAGHQRRHRGSSSARAVAPSCTRPAVDVATPDDQGRIRPTLHGEPLPRSNTGRPRVRPKAPRRFESRIPSTPGWTESVGVRVRTKRTFCSVCAWWPICRVVVSGQALVR